jgi:hypothetical protein
MPVKGVCKTTSLFNDKPVKPYRLIAKSLSSELPNALLRLIAQHSQVKPTVKLTIEPTIETTVDIHRYMIRADHDQFNNILIDTQSKLIVIDSTTMPIDIQSKPITIATIMRIQAFIGHLAIYAS